MTKPKARWWRVVFGAEDERFMFEVCALDEAEAREAARAYGKEIEIRVPEDADVVRVLA